MAQNQKDIYGEHYYQHCCGQIPYERGNPHYIQFFERIADWICKNLSPASAIDIGCAMGFLVEALRDRGVEAYGVDISEYAISQVRDDIKPYCRIGSAADPLPREYDLVTCIEVLEHIQKGEARQAVVNMARSASRIIFSSSPSDTEEKSHINVQPPIYWLGLFAKEGFYPDFGVDLSSIVSPHAFLLKRDKPDLNESISFFAQALQRRIDMIYQQSVLDERQAQIDRLKQELRKPGSPATDNRGSLETDHTESCGIPREIREEIYELQATIQTQDLAILISPFARRIYAALQSFRRWFLPKRARRLLGWALQFRPFHRIFLGWNWFRNTFLGAKSLSHPSLSGHWPGIPPLNIEAKPGEARKLNVLIPGLQIWAMSGGPNTAINLTLRLAREGIPVRYISTDVGIERDQGALWDHFRQLSDMDVRHLPIEIVDGHDRNTPVIVGERDLFLCTAWWTVRALEPTLDRMKTRKFIYLIQEFEPGLYPWSGEYAEALSTYGADFKGVINEALVKEFLINGAIGRFGSPGFAEDCLTFEPAVDRRKFYPDENRQPSRRRFLFYSRPDAPRNLFSLGLAALRTAVKRGAFTPDGWEAFFLGGGLSPMDLGSGMKIKSCPWLGYDAYAALLRDSDVGLSLMLSPHTSYPPLEMAASGMVVVTNNYSVKTSSRLQDISDNIIPVDISIDSIVQGLVMASLRSGNMAARSARGKSTKLPGCWEEAFAGILPKLKDFFSNTAA